MRDKIPVPLVGFWKWFDQLAMTLLKQKFTNEEIDYYRGLYEEGLTVDQVMEQKLWCPS